MQPKHQTFNDGFLQYGHNLTNRSSTGKRIGESFIPKGKLAYHIMSARDEDYKYAGMMGASLDLKIMTRLPPSFRNINKSKLKVRIGNVEYDVLKTDRDKNGRNLYFYLQEVGVISE